MEKGECGEGGKNEVNTNCFIKF